MAKVGYIFLAEAYESVESDKAWMEKFGCVKIVEENAEDEKLIEQIQQCVAWYQGTFLLPRTMPYQGDTHYLHSRQG